jgi:hypothetical protein
MQFRCSYHDKLARDMAMSSEHVMLEVQGKQCDLDLISLAQSVATC